MQGDGQADKLTAHCGISMNVPALVRPQEVTLGVGLVLEQHTVDFDGLLGIGRVGKVAAESPVLLLIVNVSLLVSPRWSV